MKPVRTFIALLIYASSFSDLAAAMDLKTNLKTKVSATSESPIGERLNQEILPDCKFQKLKSTSTELAICKLEEKSRHFLTEFRFRHSGKIFYRYIHMDDPTGGVPSAKVDVATDNYVVFELGGDESNQLIGFNLRKKSMMFNSGKVTGLGDCKVQRSPELFCFVALNCSVFDTNKNQKSSNLSFSEYLCPCNLQLRSLQQSNTTAN